ncbi:uncharacterized protein LOC106135245 [Amyelois transitella]|uniref:uncharacterized protein LOC106135245 n=1 Tax=Amyelois transitella TaxID=680683 RepID=UPI00067D7326|nr:uncharacterized protein LOC106135245 [Amyelois transitella]
MLITLLLIAQVGCEWVQISQQHFVKPFRPSHKHQGLTRDTNLDQEQYTTPKSNTIYLNQSLNEHKWKETDLMHNKGFVTKVEADDIIRGDNKPNSHIVHTNNAIRNPNVEYHKDDDEDISDAYVFKFNGPDQLGRDQNRIRDEETTVSTMKHHEDVIPKIQNNVKRYGHVTGSQVDVFEESYDTIPNVGSIKKVHLDTRTVRTPILKEMSKKQFGTSSSHNIITPVHADSDKEQFTRRPVIIWKSDDQTKKVVPGIIQKVPKEHLNRGLLGNNSKYHETTLDIGHSKNKDMFITNLAHSSEVTNGQTVKLSKMPDINFEKPVFVTKEDFDDEGMVTVSNENSAGFNEETTESNQKSNTVAPKPKAEKGTEAASGKVNTMENVLKFMRIVTDTISRNTRRSVGSKVKYLENLEDTIMANIKHRIDTLWPDDSAKTPEVPRTMNKRSADTARGGGHVEFPSSESALMTISFLTFAVYLIKLVLQVIHTYKNKAMMMTPAVVTAVGRTVYRRADKT